MVITHHGGQCFKVTFGDLTLVFDPVAKGGTLPAVRFGADIALISRNHPDMNGAAEVTYGDKEPFVISGPGEYEKEGVTVQGFPTKSQYGTKKGEDAVNTAYAVKLEGMTLLHLGALSEATLPLEARESIDEVDILFVPIGGNGQVLDPSEASKLATFLEPKVVIPMHWSGMGESDALETFLKEEGGTHEKVDKLTVKKKDVADKDGAIIVVTP